AFLAPEMAISPWRRRPPRMRSLSMGGELVWATRASHHAEWFWYSAGVSVNPNFDNDITEIELNNLSKAKTILHFTAADEHRANFSLTKTNVGKEREFPGVHSDVGGSYNDGVEVVKVIEKNFEEKLKGLSEKLIAQSWYLENQLDISYFGPQHELKGTRKLSKNYSYIPLHFMAESAIAQKIPFNIKKIEINKYGILDDDLLTRVKKRLRAYFLGEGEPYKLQWFGDIHEKYRGVTEGHKYYNKYQQELQEQKDLRKLRNQYLHWSADNGSIGMESTKDRKRKTF
ncbi:MAG: hypothetical protein ABI892_10205, partial [Flavobacterium sp.]